MTGMPFAANSILGKKFRDAAPGSGKKEKVPAYLNVELLDRLRDTVVGLQRDPTVEEPPVSLSAFVEEAVQAAVEQAEREHNGGERFPARPNRHLKTGPPIGG